MYQVNLKNPENETEITVVINDAVDDSAAKAKALEILRGPNANIDLAEGYEATLVRKVSAVLFPDAGEVMFCA